MPKKAPKNAFYFYMIDFKEEQRKKGINYSNMAEVANAAGLIWKDAPPGVRSKFEARAKKEKQKYNGIEHKYTSDGRTYAELDQEEKELQEAIENEKKDIINLVNTRVASLPKMDIYLMDINCYCKASVDYVVGEIALLRFNIHEGIKDSYHELINPGSIPVGYVSDVKYGCQDLGLKMPDESANRSNYMKTLANIIDYLRQQSARCDVLPPLFTAPDKVAQVHNFVLQMCRRAGEDDSLFRIYQLNTLFFNMVNTLRTQELEGFPKESLALAALKKDAFKYTSGIGCEHHEEIDKSVECCLSRVKRWAYTVLDTACPVAGVPVHPGKHVPPDFDLESIHMFQEQKQARNAPTVAHMQSANSSICDRSSEKSYSDVTRKHRPLRLPKNIDAYGKLVRAPELTELSGATPLAGKCPSMPGQLNKLKLDD